MFGTDKIPHLSNGQIDRMTDALAGWVCYTGCVAGEVPCIEAADVESSTARPLEGTRGVTAIGRRGYDWLERKREGCKCSSC